MFPVTFLFVQQMHTHGSDAYFYYIPRQSRALLPILSRLVRSIFQTVDSDKVSTLRVGLYPQVLATFVANVPSHVSQMHTHGSDAYTHYIPSQSRALCCLVFPA